MELRLIGFLIAFTMCLLLICLAYSEAIKISNSEGRVEGTTLIFAVPSACVFTIFTFILS